MLNKGRVGDFTLLIIYKCIYKSTILMILYYFSGSCTYILHISNLVDLIYKLWSYPCCDLVCYEDECWLVSLASAPVVIQPYIPRVYIHSADSTLLRWHGCHNIDQGTHWRFVSWIPNHFWVEMKMSDLTTMSQLYYSSRVLELPSVMLSWKL